MTFWPPWRCAMVNTDAEVEEARTKLDPENLTGEELDRYIFPRVGLIRREGYFRDRNPDSNRKWDCKCRGLI